MHVEANFAFLVFDTITLRALSMLLLKGVFLRDRVLVEAD